MRALKGTRGIQLNITARRSSGVAPFSVHFDATSTVSPNTSDTFRKVWYAWNFGESSGPGVAAWTVGVQNTTRNLANGPIASHLYETPGNYTAQCIATDGVNTAVWSQSITVWDPDVDNSGSGGPNYTGTRTVCYSTSGTFTSAPSGCTQVTTSNFATVVSTMETNGNGFRYLLRGGESFDMATAGDSSTNNWSRDDVLVGSFGSGKATITTSGACATARASPFNIGRDARPAFSRLIIRDMHITPGGTAMGTEAMYFWSGRDVTMVRVTGDGTRMLVNSSVWADYFNSHGNPGHQVNPGLALWDCDLVNVVDGNPADTSTWAYGAFIYATFASIQGNKFDVNATGTNRSHCLRMPYQYKTVVANNRMQQPGNQEHCIKLHSETLRDINGQGFQDWATQSAYGPTGVSGGWTDYVWITANDIVGGVNSGLVAVGSPSGYGGGANPDVATQIRHWSVSGNKFSSGASGTFQFGVMAWAEQGLIANNVASITTSSSGRACFAGLGDREYMLGSGPQTGTVTMPFAQDVLVLNNSGYFAAATASVAEMVFVQTDAINCTVKNNALWAPNESGTISCVSGSDLVSNTAVIATGYSASNNSTNTQSKQGTSPFATSTPSTLANFAPAGGGYLLNGGAYVGLQKDINALIRSLTTPTIGAVEA